MKSKATKFILGIFLALALALSLVVPVFAADLTGVTNTPTDNAAGATTTHTVAFTTATNLPINGKMKVAFPSGFNVSGATLGTITGPDGSFTLSRDGQVLIVSRSGGTVFNAGNVTIAFNGVVNHQTVGNTYTVDVVTTDAFNGYIDGPNTSAAFEIVPADLATLTVQVQPTQTVAGDIITPAVTVLAEDAFDNVIAGVDVDVALNKGAFASGTTTRTTDGNGIATFDDLIINVADTGYVLEFSDDTTGLITGDSNAFNVVPDDLDELVVVDQPTQTIAGDPIASAINGVTVLALDQFDNPRAGDDIDVALNKSAFASGTTTRTTGIDGIATFDDLIINVADTGYVLEFSDDTTGLITDDSDAFDVIPADLATLTVQVQPTQTIAGDAIAPAVTVLALDQFGNPRAGDDIDVALNKGAFAAGSTTTETTAGNGIATFDDLIINVADTGYVLEFSDTTGLITDDSDAFDVIPADLATLTVQVQPTQTIAGDAIAPAVTVLAEHAFDNVIAGVDIDVALNKGAFAAGSTTTETTAGNGIATFDDLIINVADTGYVLEFSDDTTGLITDDSDPFDVVALDQLVMVNQPQNTVAGEVIQGASPVQVQALDTLGAPIASVNVNVTLNKSAFASGTTTRTTGIDGIAAFNDLVINVADTDYLLHFASGAINTDSALFDVTPAAVDTLTIVQQPTDAAVNEVIAPPVTVRAEDEFNNLIEGLDVTATLIGIGTLSGTLTQQTDGTGIATFDDLSIDMPGCKKLEFSGSASVTSDEFKVGTTCVELDANWNLMSLPIIPNDTDIDTVLACIEDDVLSIWYYDAVINDWLIYAPPAFNTLTTIEDGKAYWFNMDDAVELWIDGRELPAPPGLPPVYDVVAGWNMVGFKSIADMSAVDYLNAMAGKYTRIYGFENGAWFTIPPPNYNNPLMKPGLGYWVSFTQDGDIYP